MVGSESHVRMVRHGFRLAYSKSVSTLDIQYASPTQDQLAELAEMARAFNGATTSSPPLTYRAPATRVRRRLSPGAIARLVERYEAGEHTPALSREFGISGSSLCTLLRSEGVALRRRPIDADAKKRVVGLYAQGASIRRVAKVVGYSYGTIRKMLHREGVGVRENCIKRVVA
jgi:transposase